MKNPLFKYREVLLNVQPLRVEGVVSTLAQIHAHSELDLLNSIKEDCMRRALIEAGRGSQFEVDWEYSDRADGLHVYTEFYIFTREKLASLLDDVYSQGKRDGIMGPH